MNLSQASLAVLWYPLPDHFETMTLDEVDAFMLRHAKDVTLEADQLWVLIVEESECIF